MTKAKHRVSCSRTFSTIYRFQLLAKTKCGLHYYRVSMSYYRYPWSFLASSTDAAKGVKMLLPIAITIIVFTHHCCFCCFLTPCQSLGIHSSAKMDLFFTTWLLWLRLITNIMAPNAFPSPKKSFVSFFMLFSEVVNGFDLTWIFSPFSLCVFCNFLLMFINEKSSFAGRFFFFGL